MSVADEWQPFDAQYTREQIDGLLEMIDHDHSVMLDLGCGSGRVLVPLLERGCEIIGVEDSDAAIDECVRLARERTSHVPSIVRADFLAESDLLARVPSCDFALCLGNTLMTVTSFIAMERFFSRCAHQLAHGRALVIDDFPFECWDEVTQGNWQAGITDDGSEQLVFVPGEPEFVYRTGDEVDPNSWSVKPGEPIRRLWSMAELNHFAAQARFLPGHRIEASHLLVFARPGQEQAWAGSR